MWRYNLSPKSIEILTQHLKKMKMYISRRRSWVRLKLLVFVPLMVPEPEFGHICFRKMYHWVSSTVGVQTPPTVTASVPVPTVPDRRHRQESWPALFLKPCAEFSPGQVSRGRDPVRRTRPSGDRGFRSECSPLDRFVSWTGPESDVRVCVCVWT